MKIALLGAESTGKTTLTHDIAARLRGRGHRVTVVEEALRAWCRREGRLPGPQEHAGIARAQEQAVDEAAAASDIVLADTSALVVALYGGLRFSGEPGWEFAKARQRRYDLTLLTGLDLPWVADGLQREGPRQREAFDAMLREALREAGVDWRMVYGTGEERMLNALEAVAEVAPWAWSARPQPAVRWKGMCEACSDPECEHRLFRGLRTRE